MKSLRWRIMGSLVIVIVLTVLISVGVGYYATQFRLGDFVERIGSDEAARLARNLGREYTASGGWDTAESVLSEAGYIYGEAEHSEGAEGAGGPEGESEGAFHRDPIGIVIVDTNGRVVVDNLSDLSPGSLAPELEGRRETVFDLSVNQPVGHVYVDVNNEFLSTESSGFLDTLLYITLIGGAVTAVVAIVLAAWLSRRITAPVKALTEATQAIAQGTTARLPVTSSDELGTMSAAFNRMTSALETQRELRRRLINDISHELNTPLTVIQLEAKGLGDGLQSPESASGHIIREVARLRGLVTDLNSLAETDMGELGLDPEASSIYDMLTAEVDRWQPQCQGRQVELSLEASPDLPNLEIDRMRMSQALGNVIGNAINYTDPGGSILIRAGLGSEGALGISIVDDGMGIDAADLPHVFDRFYRADQSRSREVGGTGLGLAIARAIIEAHGGTINLASEGPGRGVTVTILLPLYKSGSGPDAHSQSSGEKT